MHTVHTWHREPEQPQGETDKVAFIEELKQLQPFVRPEWLILGDFNLITRASNKNNDNINGRLIGKFRRAKNLFHLKDYQAYRSALHLVKRSTEHHSDQDRPHVLHR
jgi:hypothetical protein